MRAGAIEAPPGGSDDRAPAIVSTAGRRERAVDENADLLYIPRVNESASLTELIERALGGDGEAADALFAATYDDLRKLARNRLRAGGRNTLLDTSSLVHESYLRFVGARRLRLEDRAHFVHWAGRVMRSVIVDFARRRSAQRRGAGASRAPLTVQLAADHCAPADEILRVHEALERLAALDARMAQVVEMRYFGGLTESEIALALGVTERTVRRDWEKARLLLREALE
jgi:RNA polymerase sigma factor (TIGR02999 family)